MKKNVLFFFLILICGNIGNKNQGFVRKLDTADFSDTETDYTDYNSDFLTNDITQNTETEYFSDTDIITSQNNSTLPPNNGYSPLFIIIGFGNYNFNINIISFLIYAKRIYSLYSYRPKNLIIVVHLSFKRTVRSLEEDKEEEVNCALVGDENASTLEYNCNLNSSSQPSKLSVDIKNPERYNMIFSSIANKNKDNILSQTSTTKPEVYILNNSSYSKLNDFSFTINGTIEDLNETNAKEMTNGNIILLLQDKGNNMEKNVTCKMSQKQYNNKSYELTCTPKESINANLNNTAGVLQNNENKQLVILTKEGNNSDPVSILIPFNSFGNKKDAGRGLTGGAIAAIVIVCVAVILAVSILAVIFNKHEKNSPLEQPSTVGMFESNANITN